MDQDKVNPFVGNTETPAGGTPVSATPTASVDSAVSAPDPVNPYVSAVPPTEANSATPVNPYAPAGAPYAPGSNTPAPSYADPISPAVPNTSAPDPAYTSFSPAPSQDFVPMDTPERPKLFTKKFVIFAVIGLVLIAGAVVAGLVLQGSRSGGSGGGSSSNTTTNNIPTTVTIADSSIKNESATVKTVFYKYSNWILNGTTEETPPTKTSEPDRKTVYYIREVFSDKESDFTEYMFKAREYSKEFVQSAEKNSKNDAFKSVVSSNDGDVEFLYNYSKNKVLSTDEIMQLYVSLGKDGAISEIKSRYVTFEEMKNYNANQYATMVVDYSSLVLDFLEDLNTNGCLVNGVIDESCKSLQLSQSDQAREKNIAILEKYSDINSLINSTITTIINNCWTIENGDNIAGGVNE